MKVIEYTETTVEETDGIRVETALPREAVVLPFPGKDREWLARDIMSTPYATILTD